MWSSVRPWGFILKAQPKAVAHRQGLAEDHQTCACTLRGSLESGALSPELLPFTPAQLCLSRLSPASCAAQAFRISPQFLGHG